MCRLYSVRLPREGPSGGGRLQPRCGAQHCSLASRPGSLSVLSNPVRATPGTASPGCALGGRSPWRMSWSWWRRRWSRGYVDPQLGGGAGPGGMLWPKEGEGRAPPPLRPAPPSRPQPGISCLVGLPRGPRRWYSLRLLTAPLFGRCSSEAFVEDEALVWPQGRAGQGRKMSALLAEAAFLGPLKGTWLRVKQIQGVWPALWGSWIPPPNRSLKGSGRRREELGSSGSAGYCPGATRPLRNS